LTYGEHIISLFGGVPMRRVTWPVGLALLALAAAVLLAFTSTVQAALTLAAATYLLKGTESVGRIASDQQVIDLATPWIIGTTGAAPPKPIIVVDYPARIWPVTAGGFSDPTFDQSVAAGVAALPSPRSVEPGTVFSGGSQGAVVVSLYKREFNETWAKHPQKAPEVVFGLIANVMRPNGGILERFAPLGTIPIVDLTFYGATPTQTAGAGQGEITTYDIARQYDGFSDFPTNPLFGLSDINAAIGILLIHPDVSTVSMQDAVLQDEYGDTRYYMIPTYPVPLLMPLEEQIPTVGPILADMLDPAVRLLVEAGYDRTISPGQPTPANFLYFPNPIALGENLLIAIPTGLDNGWQDIIGVRPFGTERPDVTGQGAYGIDGQPVTMNPTTNEQQTAITVSGHALMNTDNLMAASEHTALAVERVPALKSYVTPSTDNQLSDENVDASNPPSNDNQPLSDENVGASNPPSNDNQPLSDEKVDTSNSPTMPRETETTQRTTPTEEVTANPVPPKIHGPFRSNRLMKEKELTPSPKSVFNKDSTVTTSATTGAGTPTGDGSPPHGGSPSDEVSRSVSLPPNETSGRMDRTGAA
jgi:PE-PPE domain